MANRTNEEVEAVRSYLAVCAAGQAGRYFSGSFYGTCALTRSVIKPYMDILYVADGKYVRRAAVEQISVRGNETLDDVLGRFGWASPELAAEWIARGSTVILMSATNLRPKVVRARRAIGSVTLDEVRPLYWRSVAFMIRRDGN